MGSVTRMGSNASAGRAFRTDLARLKGALLSLSYTRFRNLWRKKLSVANLLHVR